MTRKRYAAYSVRYSLRLIHSTQLKRAKKDGRLAEALLDRRAKLKRYGQRFSTHLADSDHPCVVIVSAEHTSTCILRCLVSGTNATLFLHQPFTRRVLHIQVMRPSRCGVYRSATPLGESPPRSPSFLEFMETIMEPQDIKQLKQIQNLYYFMAKTHSSSRLQYFQVSHIQP